MHGCCDCARHTPNTQGVLQCLLQSFGLIKSLGLSLISLMLFPLCFAEEDVENFDVTNLSQDVLRSIEADSFWCMSKLLDGIQVSLWGHRNSSALTGVAVWLSPLLVWVSILHAPALGRFFCFTELNLLVKS